MSSLRNSRRKTDVIGECIDKLHEKRRAVREEGMDTLVAALEGFVPVDELDYRYFTVFDRCCASLRKGACREATLAYRAIGLLALTVVAATADGVDCSKDILEKALPVLEETLHAPSSGAATMVAALDCLAAVTLAGTRRPEDAAPSVEAVWGAIRRAQDETKPSPEVLAAAVRAFALLLTTVGDLTSYPCTFKEAIIPFHDLAELLECEHPAVRIAAGEALAVCAELSLTQHASPEDIQVIEMILSDLAADASSDQNLTEEQVEFFQQIADIMSQGGCPETEESVPSSYTSGRSVLRVSTWARLVQLNFLKRFLNKGFRKHLQDNLLFREQVDSSDAVDEADEQPSGKGRRRGGGREKRWSSAMRRDRDICWENKNGFSVYD
ncbi:uncharacterized protein [Aegilops tauschii subsp. strangulata]|uniref:Interferon-related developmental regulator N-terminal domain-containing protein n=2 Tax=Aegilops tauschii subsp. strangulata TaxID=200361 RepID=A0A453NS50_AEGTS